MSVVCVVYFDTIDKMLDYINQIASDKLDKRNFHVWNFRMTDFLMGIGIWNYVEGGNEDPLELLQENGTTIEIKTFKEDWNQGTRKVIYVLFLSIIDTVIGYI